MASAFHSFLAVSILLVAFSAQAVPKFFGCIWQSWSGDPPASFTANFNQVSPENAGKWGSVERTRGSFSWGTLDAMYAWAETHSATTRQHTFIWNSSMPSWLDALNSSDTKTAVANWIGKYMARYGSKVDMIDVVNECWRTPGFAGDLGGGGLTGWDWVIWCYQTARDTCNKYAPNARLILNLEQPFLGNQYNIAMQVGKLLKDRGLLDGLGDQSHYYEGADTGGLHRNMNQLYNALLVPLDISELDIDEPDDQKQLATMKKLIPLYWQHPHVEGITLWGYQQNNMWRSNGYLERSDGTERPAWTWLKNYIKSTTPVAEMQILQPVKPDFASHAAFYSALGRLVPALSSIRGAAGLVIAVPEGIAQHSGEMKMIAR